MHLLLHLPQVLPADPPKEFKGTVSRDFLFYRIQLQPKDVDKILGILLMHLLLHHPQVLPAVPPREFKGTVSRDFFISSKSYANLKTRTKFQEFYSCISSSTTRRFYQLFHLGNLKRKCHEIFLFRPTQLQPKDAHKILKTSLIQFCFAQTGCHQFAIFIQSLIFNRFFLCRGDCKLLDFLQFSKMRRKKLSPTAINTLAERSDCDHFGSTEVILKGNSFSDYQILYTVR